MFHLIKDVMSLTRDLVTFPQPEKILSGSRLFRHFMRHQQAWLNHFHPHDMIIAQKGSWHYLQKYVMPLIKQRASSYHLHGIAQLELDAEEIPDFDNFCELFFEASNGFSIVPVTKEIDTKNYFKLISQKQFPCIDKLRPVNEIFCANEPDFWHEAIGHIAPLCFAEVQDLYMSIAEFILTAKSAEEFKQHEAVAWTITEYGFLKQHGVNKMFGAALVGSHLAHMRYENNLINIEPASRQVILESGFFDDSTPISRNADGLLRFFNMDDLNIEYLFK